MEATRIILFGASGRMGQEILRILAGHAGVDLVSALVRPGSTLEGEPVWPGRTSSLSYATTLEPEQQGEVLVDFSNAVSFDAALALAVEREMAFVSGTTGLSEAQHDELEAAARRIPVLWSANFSIGVALLRRLAVEAARVLGEDFDVEIIESHHRLKRDAPSGTALAIGRAIAEAHGRSLDQIGAFVRHGKDSPRRRGEIGFASIRGGDIVGEHTVLFAGEGERLEFTHRAGTRALFARGALLAARWIGGRSAGTYTLDQAVAAAAPD